MDLFRSAEVVVVVPVYRGVDLTRECLRTAMLGGLEEMPNALLVVINDSSPDGGMAAMLEEQRGLFPDKLIVLRNDSNQGFVKTANRGILYSKSADVVLLNSDVVVGSGWLESLVQDAYSAADAGTVTPLSNNTTITSFPNFMRENRLPFGLSVSDINSALYCARLPLVEAPTGVGFCMYVKRACLNEVGLLDEVSFGTGYGEENDFCQRALQFGWKNYISPNVYVHHVGGVSFGAEREARLSHAAQVLNRRYPRYHIDVQAFVGRDDLQQARWHRYIDLVRGSGQPVVLHVSHGLGGGVAQHIQELAAAGEGKVVALVLQPEYGGKLLSIGAWDADHSMRIAVDAEDDGATLVRFLEALGVSLIHFHHVMGLTETFLALLCRFPAKCFFTCHDFYTINANPTLTDENGVFSFGTVSEAVNPLYPLPSGVSSAAWRDRYRSLIENCDRVIFPSWSTFDIFFRYFRLKSYVVAPHLEVEANDLNARQARKDSRKFIVGVLGALSREKGAELLEHLVASAKKEGRLLEFILIGYAFRPLRGVRSTGPYDASKLLELVREQQCDALFFPAQWPETYSYTLSVALRSGLPIVAPSIGAFPERLAGRTGVYLFPHPPKLNGLSAQLGDFLLGSDFGSSVSHCGYGPSAIGDYYKESYWGEIGAVPQLRDRQLVMNDFDAIFAAKSVQVQTGKERILRILWRLYSSPQLQVFSRLIPHRVKREVKRRLSKRPMHEILSGE